VNQLMAELIAELRMKGAEMRRGRAAAPSEQETLLELTRILERHRGGIMQALHRVIHEAAQEPQEEVN
jgi:hypothetical protein